MCLQHTATHGLAKMLLYTESCLDAVRHGYAMERDKVKISTVCKSYNETLGICK